MLAVITVSWIVDINIINVPAVTVIHCEVHRITCLTSVVFLPSLESSIQKDFLLLCSTVGLISSKVCSILMAYFSNYYTIGVYYLISIVSRVLWNTLNFKKEKGICEYFFLGRNKTERETEFLKGLVTFWTYWKVHSYLGV